MKASVTTTILLAAVATGAQAAEGAVHDLRLGFTAMSSDVSTEWTFSSGSVSAGDTYDRETDGRSRVSLGMIATAGQPAPLSLIYGVGVAFEAAEYSAYDESWGEEISQTWTGVIIDGQLGCAFVVSNMFHVEAAGVLGLGAGVVEISDISGVAFDSASAGILEYGVRLGGYVTIEKLQLGLEIGYMSTAYLGAEWEDANDPSLTYGEDSEFSGAFVGLTLGVRI